MENTFDSQNDIYLVLLNAEGQYSLWPVSADIPTGWTSCHGPADRQSCLVYVDGHWTDMRPKSLSIAMADAK